MDQSPPSSGNDRTGTLLRAATPAQQLAVVARWLRLARPPALSDDWVGSDEALPPLLVRVLGIAATRLVLALVVRSQHASPTGDDDLAWQSSAAVQADTGLSLPHWQAACRTPFLRGIVQHRTDAAGVAWLQLDAFTLWQLCAAAEATLALPTTTGRFRRSPRGARG